MPILDKPAEGRPWWKRMTMWGATLIGAMTAAEVTGMVPAGTATQLQDGAVLIQQHTTSLVAAGKGLVEVVGGMLMAVGLYRKIS